MMVVKPFALRAFKISHGFCAFINGNSQSTAEADRCGSNARLAILSSSDVNTDRVSMDVLAG